LIEVRAGATFAEVAFTAYSLLLLALTAIVLWDM
jgi:succinate-acetate transporter protein